VAVQTATTLPQWTNYALRPESPHTGIDNASLGRKPALANDTTYGASARGDNAVDPVAVGVARVGGTLRLSLRAVVRARRRARLTRQEPSAVSATIASNVVFTISPKLACGPVSGASSRAARGSRRV